MKNKSFYVIMICIFITVIGAIAVKEKIDHRYNIPEGFKEYCIVIKINRGDNLYNIASTTVRLYGLPCTVEQELNELCRLNDITTPSLIQEGTIINVPVILRNYDDSKNYGVLLF